jgi:hypothetical protein
MYKFPCRERFAVVIHGRDTDDHLLLPHAFMDSERSPHSLWKLCDARGAEDLAKVVQYADAVIVDDGAVSDGTSLTELLEVLKQGLSDTVVLALHDCDSVDQLQAELWLAMMQKRGAVIKVPSLVSAEKEHACDASQGISTLESPSYLRLRERVQEWMCSEDPRTIMQWLETHEHEAVDDLAIGDSRVMRWTLMADAACRRWLDTLMEADGNASWAHLRLVMAQLTSDLGPAGLFAIRLVHGINSVEVLEYRAAVCPDDLTLYEAAILAVMRNRVPGGWGFWLPECTGIGTFRLVLC